MSESVNFIQGRKEQYNPSEMQGGLFFSKDSKEILLNGESYGNATPADEEDITAEDGNLKLKDRAYDEANFSGKGYKILRKNIQEVTVPKFDLTISTGCTTSGNITINEIPIAVTTEASTPEAVAQLIQSAISGTTISGAVVTFTSNPVVDYSTTGVNGQIVDNSYQENRNILTQSMISDPNTTYEVRYDFELESQIVNQTSTLIFNGGSINCNGYALGVSNCINANITNVGSYLQPSFISPDKITSSSTYNASLPFTLDITKLFGTKEYATPGSTRLLSLNTLFDTLEENYSNCYLNIVIPNTFPGGYIITKPIKVYSTWSIDFNNVVLKTSTDFKGSCIFDFQGDISINKGRNTIKNIELILYNKSDIDCVFNISFCPHLIENVKVNCQGKSMYGFWQERTYSPYRDYYSDNKIISNVNFSNLKVREHNGVLLPQSIIRAGDGCIIQQSFLGSPVYINGRSVTFKSCIQCYVYAHKSQVNFSSSYWERAYFKFNDSQVTFNSSMIQTINPNESQDQKIKNCFECDTQQVIDLFRYIDYSDSLYQVEGDEEFKVSKNKPSNIIFINCLFKTDQWYFRNSYNQDLFKTSGNTQINFIGSSDISEVSISGSVGYPIRGFYIRDFVDYPKRYNWEDNYTFTLDQSNYEITNDNQQLYGAFPTDTQISCKLYLCIDQKRALYHIISDNLEGVVQQGYRGEIVIRKKNNSFSNHEQLDLPVLMVLTIDDITYTGNVYLKSIQGVENIQVNNENKTYEVFDENISFIRLCSIFKSYNGASNYNYTDGQFQEGTDIEYNECTSAIRLGSNIFFKANILPEFGEFTVGDKCQISDKIYEYNGENWYLTSELGWATIE